MPRRGLPLAALVLFFLFMTKSGTGMAVRAQSLTDAQTQIASTIVYWANYYGDDPNQLLRVATCESQLDPTAVSPAGAEGVMQFMPVGGIWSITPYGQEGLVPFDVSTSEQIRMAAWLFSLGYASQWDCA